MKLLRELRLRNSNVAGEFAGRKPDENGDVAFDHALRRVADAERFGCLLGLRSAEMPQ